MTVADVPDDYDTRLIPMQVDGLDRIRLRAFERHDFVLAKLRRNIDRDRRTWPPLRVALDSTSTSSGSDTATNCGRSWGDRTAKT